MVDDTAMLPKEAACPNTSTTSRLSALPMVRLRPDDRPDIYRAVQDLEHLGVNARCRSHRRVPAYGIIAFPGGDDPTRASNHRHKRDQIPRVHDRIDHDVGPCCGNEQVAIAVTPSSVQARTFTERFEPVEILVPLDQT